MLAEAIGAIIGLSFLFFICGLICYCLCRFIFKDQDIDTTKPATEAWEAKHYYDPPPSVITPPETIFQPTPYSFKVRNGTHAHAVINPAVLHPPGHALDYKHKHEPSQFKFSSHSYNKSRNSYSKVSPTNDQRRPLVLSDSNETEMVYMSNGYATTGRKDSSAWHP